MLQKAIRIKSILTKNSIFLPFQYNKISQLANRLMYFYSNYQNEPINFNKCRHVSSIVNLYTSLQNISYNELIEMFAKLIQLKNQISSTRIMVPIMKKIFSINYLQCPKQLVILTCQLYQNFYTHRGSDIQIENQILQRVNKEISNTNDVLQVNELLQIMRFAIFMDNQRLLSKVNQLIMKNISYLKVKNIKKYIQIMRKKQLFHKFQKQTYNSVIQKLENTIQFIKISQVVQLYISTKPVSNLTFKTQNIIAEMEERIDQNILNLEYKQIKMLLSFKSHLNIFIKKILQKIIQNIEEVDKYTDQIMKKKITVSYLLIQISQFYQLKYLDQQKQNYIVKFFMNNLFLHKQIQILLTNRFFPINTVIELNNFIISNNIKKFLNSVNYVYSIVEYNQIKMENFKNIDEVILNIQKKNFSFNQNPQKFIKIALLINRYCKEIGTNTKLLSLRNEYIQKISSILKQYKKLILLPKNIQKQQIIQHFHTQFGHFFLLSYYEEFLNFGKIGLLEMRYFFQAHDYLMIKLISTYLIKSFKPLSIIKFFQSIKKNPRSFVNFYGPLFELCNNKQVLTFYQKQILQIVCNFQVHILLRINQCIKLLELLNQNIMNWKNNELIIQNIFFCLENSPQNLFKKCKQYAQIFQKIQQSSYFSNQMTKMLIFYNKMKKQYAEKLLLKQNIQKNTKNYLQIIAQKNSNPIIIKMNTKTLLQILRSGTIKQSQLQSKLKDILSLINKADHKTIQQLIMNFSLQITVCSSKILNLLIKKYTQYINSPDLKQLNVEYIFFALIKIPFKDASQYKLFLNTIRISSIFEYNKTPQQIHFLFIKQCLRYQINVKYYLQQILIQCLRQIDRRSSDMIDFNQFCQLILTIQPKNGLNLLEHVKRQETKWISTKLQKKILNQNLIQLISLTNLENQEYCQFMINYLLSHKNEQIPESFLTYLMNKNHNMGSLIQNIQNKNNYKYKLTSLQTKVFKQLVKFNLIQIQFISISKIEYQIVLIEGLQFIKLNNKWITISHKYFHPYLDQKLIQLYSHILKLPNKNDQIKIFYMNPIRNRYQLINYLFENLPTLQDTQIVKNKIHNIVDL